MVTKNMMKTMLRHLLFRATLVLLFAIIRFSCSCAMWLNVDVTGIISLCHVVH